MDDALWEISLDPWIIRDGNYPDFRVGQKSSFAVEFHSKQDPIVTDQPSRCVSLGNADYNAIGVVRFVSKDVWVVEYGGMLTYTTEKPPRRLVSGKRVSGRITLGLDSFDYFESLHALPGMPPLIYHWRIREIIMETAPFEERISANGYKYYVRDESRLRREAVSDTNAWSEDCELASYVLHCERLPIPPSHRRPETA